jgi:NAD(P)H-dependent FMN reductase
MQMDKLKIKIILGSVREGRNGEKVWNWLKTQLSQFNGLDFELVDLKELNLPMFDESEVPMADVPPKSPAAQLWKQKMGESDGFIIITPEYNHFIPGALKNAFDFLAKEWKNKPVAIISYGASAGGVRAAEDVKKIFFYMQSFVIPTEINIPYVWDAFDANGNLPEKLSVISQKQLVELQKYTEYYKNLRENLGK